MVYRPFEQFRMCVAPLAGVVLLSSCVMGGPEEVGDPMDPRMHDPIEIEFYQGYVAGDDEAPEEKSVHSKGKADDADHPTKNEDNPTGTNDKAVDDDDTACWTEEELEGEGLPGEADAPSNEETGHGSPQPLDPCDSDDEDDSDSEDSDDS
jgi:hypothetical protein